jgi:predicted AAA+ superfamily ATPase
MRDVIRRKYYFERIKPFIDNNIIKVIVGQRRSGKSYFLFQIINELDSNDVNIIYINKELYEFHFINDYTDLLNHINANVDNGKKNKIFIDEIQDIKDFEKALRSLQAEEKYDIYITGSNANLLSGELATYLSGRYIQINIYPLTYSEFLEFHNLNNSNESFSKYIRYGGLPYIKNLQLSDEIVFDYLHNIYQSILLKDVVARNQIRNIAFLEDLSNYVADNIGNLISAKKISDYLKSQKLKASNQVVLNYLHFLTNAFLINKVKRSDLKGKKIFETGEKYYFNDIGLRNSIVMFKPNDISQILENIVYNQLKVWGYSVFVGKYNDKEIDFVCKKNDKVIYIQVTQNLSDEEVIKREFENLLLIKYNYPKYVISLDELLIDSYKGIIHLNIRDFLTNFTNY